MNSIQNFDQLCFKIEQLKEKDIQNQTEIKQQLNQLYNKSNPLTIISQVITTSFKDVKENSWTKMLNFAIYFIKENISSDKFKNSNNLLDIVIEYFSNKSNKNKTNE